MRASCVLCLAFECHCGDSCLDVFQHLRSIDVFQHVCDSVARSAWLTRSVRVLSQLSLCRSPARVGSAPCGDGVCEDRRL